MRGRGGGGAGCSYAEDLGDFLFAARDEPRCRRYLDPPGSDEAGPLAGRLFEHAAPAACLRALAYLEFLSPPRAVPGGAAPADPELARAVSGISNVVTEVTAGARRDARGGPVRAVALLRAWWRARRSAHERGDGARG